jgi:hypothetical protein
VELLGRSSVGKISASENDTQIRVAKQAPTAATPFSPSLPCNAIEAGRTSKIQAILFSNRQVVESHQPLMVLA